MPTGEKLREHLMKTLPEGERKLLGLLLDNHPASLDREQLTEITSYKRSTRDAYLKRLATRQLITCPGPGLVAATENLFV